MGNHGVSVTQRASAILYAKAYTRRGMFFRRAYFSRLL
jgi:hypothetical protein